MLCSAAFCAGSLTGENDERPITIHYVTCKIYRNLPESSLYVYYIVYTLYSIVQGEHTRCARFITRKNVRLN